MRSASAPSRRRRSRTSTGCTPLRCATSAGPPTPTTSCRRRSRPPSARSIRSRKGRTSAHGSTACCTRRSSRSTGAPVGDRPRTRRRTWRRRRTARSRPDRATSPSAEQAALSGFGPEEVREALTALPEEQRVAVYLADVEGFAYREIAEIMDSPVGTVMSRLHRGRAALRASLAGYAQRSGMVRADVGGDEEAQA